MPLLCRVTYLALVVSFASLIQSCVTLNERTTKKADPVELGNEYARDGLLREAAESYKKAIEKDAKDYVAYRNLGIVLIRAGSYKSAVRNLEKVIGKFEDDFEANFYLAEGFRATEKYAEAIYRYQKALQIREDDPKTLKALAWSYFKIRYYSEAYDIAKKLKNADPGDSQVSIIMARTLIKMQNPSAALAALRQGKRNAKKESYPYFDSVEGDAYLSMGDCKKADFSYKAALKEQPLLAGSLLGLGRCSFESGNLVQAITYMERALRIRPKLTEAMLFLGKAYESKDPKKSIRYYKYFNRHAAKDPEFLNQLSETKQRIAILSKGKK